MTIKANDIPETIYNDVTKHDNIAKACFAEQAYLSNGICNNVPCECIWLKNNNICGVYTEAVSIYYQNNKK